MRGPHPVISREPRHPGFLWVFVAGRAPSAPNFLRVKLCDGTWGVVWGAPHCRPTHVSGIFVPSIVCTKVILLGADPQGQDWVSNRPVGLLHEAWGEAGPKPAACMLCDLEQTLPLSGPELPQWKRSDQRFLTDAGAWRQGEGWTPTSHLNSLPPLFLKKPKSLILLNKESLSQDFPT